MLRLTSVLSILTWASLLLACTLALWSGFSGTAIYIGALVLGVIAIFLSLAMLIRNRAFFVGPMFLISLFGVVPGLLGVAAIFRCLAVAFGAGFDGGGSALDCLFALSLSLMLVPPINWAILWRDHRHDTALNI